MLKKTSKNLETSCIAQWKSDLNEQNVHYTTINKLANHYRYCLLFSCVFKSFRLMHDIVLNSKFIIYSRLILQILSLSIFYRKLSNISHANSSRIVPSFEMPSSLLGAPTVLNQMRFA